jgi:hypothetical protein
MYLVREFPLFPHPSIIDTCSRRIIKIDNEREFFSDGLK